MSIHFINYGYNCTHLILVLIRYRGKEFCNNGRVKSNTNIVNYNVNVIYHVIFIINANKSILFTICVRIFFHLKNNKLIIDKRHHYRKKNYSIIEKVIFKLVHLHRNRKEGSQRYAPCGMDNLKKGK